MRHSRYVKMFVAAFLMVIPTITFADFTKFLSRMELSYSYISATGLVTGTSELSDMNSSQFVPNNLGSITRTIASKTGYGGAFSVFFPLVRLGRLSTLALSTQISDCGFIWDNINTIYTTAGTPYKATSDVTGATSQIGIPIGADFKFGCDGLADRRYRLCASIGAGATTTLNGTVMSSGSYNAAAGTSIGANPYIKGEVGVDAIICMKLRFVFSFGSVPYLSGKSAVSTGDMKVTGKTNSAVSFVILPFSFLWKRSSWINFPVRY